MNQQRSKSNGKTHLLFVTCYPQLPDQWSRRKRSPFWGTGDDRLSGGNGNDTLNGGAGADLFILEAVFGTDVINDFSDGDGNQRLAMINSLPLP